MDSLHLTWSSIFAQSGAMVEEWRETGHGSVDMEAATLFAVARHFGFAAAALLAVWDQLTADRSFLDPLTAEEQTSLDASNTAVFEVALEIALDSEQLPVQPPTPGYYEVELGDPAGEVLDGSHLMTGNQLDNPHARL